MLIVSCAVCANISTALVDTVLESPDNCVHRASTGTSCVLAPWLARFDADGLLEWAELRENIVAPAEGYQEYLQAHKVTLTVCVSLSQSLSMSFTVCVSHCLSASFSVCLCLTLFVSVSYYLSMSRIVYLYLSLFVCVFCVSHSLSVSLTVCLCLLCLA